MTIEEKLVAILVPGTLVALFPVAAPQNQATPYTVYTLIDQDPIETQQQPLVTGLRCWDFQFASYSESYGTARGQTQVIVDKLMTYQDAGFRVAFLKSRKTSWDDDTKLAQSMAEFHILETLG